MTLLEVREQFARQSGRYDLVIGNSTTQFANNGADFYIQQGQAELDRMLDFPKSEGMLEVSLATGAISTTLSGVRAIRAVAVQDDQDDTVTYLSRTSIRGLRERFGDENSSLANVEAGEPMSWALGYLRDGVVASLTTEGGTLKLITLPPADRSYTLHVEGLLESAALTSDESVSFWTLKHPQVLIWAALYALEVSYRNTQGAQAYMMAIERSVTGIDSDVVEQEIVDAGHAKRQDRFILPPRRGSDSIVT